MTSFAYTAPLLIVREKYGVEGMMFGVLTAGLMYVLLSPREALRNRMDPQADASVVTASVMIVIGLRPHLLRSVGRDTTPRPGLPRHWNRPCA